MINQSPSNSRFMHLVLLLLATIAFAPSLQGQATDGATTVTLRPGDLIRVVIWREEDLSGEFPVDENSRVILPMLGEINVQGIPLGMLRDSLIEEYRKQLRNPSIQITPLRRIMVLGEVREPGLHVLDPTITLAGAIATAGGTNADGKLDRIRIVRDGIVLHERVDPSAVLHSIDVRSGDQIFIGRRSWFAQNSTYVVSTGLSLAFLLVRLF